MEKYQSYYQSYIHNVFTVRTGQRVWTQKASEHENVVHLRVMKLYHAQPLSWTGTSVRDCERRRSGAGSGEGRLLARTLRTAMDAVWSELGVRGRGNGRVGEIALTDTRETIRDELEGRAVSVRVVRKMLTMPRLAFEASVVWSWIWWRHRHFSACFG
jgi:hypothetical protein